MNKNYSQTVGYVSEWIKYMYKSAEKKLFYFSSTNHFKIENLWTIKNFQSALAQMLQFYNMWENYWVVLEIHFHKSS